MLALPIFPGRRQPSIVGSNELNYRVRNGNGWTLVLISTNCVVAKSACLRFCLRQKLRPLPCSSVSSANTSLVRVGSGRRSMSSGTAGKQLYYRDFKGTCQERIGDPYRIRTDVNGVRGRCLNHLTNGPTLSSIRGASAMDTPQRSFWCTFTDSNRGPTD